MLKQAKESEQQPPVGFLSCLLLSLTPIVSGVAIAYAPAPSQAATLAFSGADFGFSNFSQRADATSVLVEGHTSNNANPGSSIANQAEAYAIFNNPPDRPSSAFNLSSSLGLGTGTNYLGTANSKAQVLGSFSVGKNETFSFDFFGDLNLQSSIDNPLLERANATGNVYFLLVDNTDSQKQTVLDYFILSGNLSTRGGPDFLFSKRSSKVKLTNQSKEKSFGGNQELAKASVQGSYQRSFKNPTNLALIEVKENNTRQQARGLLSKSTISMELNDSVQILSKDPIFSTVSSNPTSLNSSDIVDDTGLSLSTDSIRSLMGGARDAQGSYNSVVSSKGDLKSALAQNNQAKNLLVGLTKNNSIVPDKIVQDRQLFSNVPSGAWVDPATPYGLNYTTEGDTLIDSILDFSTDDPDDLFTIAAEGKILGQFRSGDRIDFLSQLGKGVSSFTVTDLDSPQGLTNFNFRPVFNRNTGKLEAKAFDRSNSKSIPEFSSIFSLFAIGVFGVASRLKRKQS
jgi:hypothetical protein